MCFIVADTIPDVKPHKSAFRLAHLEQMRLSGQNEVKTDDMIVESVCS